MCIHVYWSQALRFQNSAGPSMFFRMWREMVVVGNTQQASPYHMKYTVRITVTLEDIHSHQVSEIDFSIN